jgi:hypothetical protein
VQDRASLARYLGILLQTDPEEELRQSLGRIGLDPGAISQRPPVLLEASTTAAPVPAG